MAQPSDEVNDDASTIAEARGVCRRAISVCVTAGP